MIFALLTLFSALAVAAVAGWFSIIGVMAIFAGAPYHAALVMGVVLELAKLVTTSWVYRNWKFAGWGLKGPLIYFTAALMLATSIGVFGFLSKAHLEQGAKTIDNGPKVERIEQQITREKAIITDNEKVIAQLDATINSYLGKDRTDRSVSIRRSQAPQRKQLKDEIDAANKRIDGFSDEKFKLQSEIRSLELEVGPIRYIAELMYGAEGNSTKNIESAVKIFTLLIVSTLDPLAIILLVAANHSILRRQNEKKQKAEEKLVGFEHGNDGDAEQARPEGIKETTLLCNPSESPSGIEISSTPNEETTVHAEIPREDVEVLNEEEKIVVEESDTGEDRLPNIANETPTDIIREILAEEPKTTTSGKAEETVQEDLSEKEVPTLAKFSVAKFNPSFAVIRSPRPSRVSSEPSQSITPKERTELEVKVQEAPVEVRKDNIVPWASQNAVMRELIGSGPHFIPQKINEEEKLTQVETPAPNTGDQTSASSQIAKTEEIFEEGQGNDQESESLESSHIASVQGNQNHKYPKALSWLREFKRT
jgi:hypothetical protein